MALDKIEHAARIQGHSGRQMATSVRIIERLLVQTSGAGCVTAKKMFGEYGLYCDGKMFGVVCDDRLYVKPTPAGRAIVGDCKEASAYPGAKPSLVIDEVRWEDGDWLVRLVKATADSLAPPKPKTGSTRR